MTRSGIVLAGTVVLDIVNIIERWPDEEQIAFIRETIPAPGGPPHNAAAGLVKLGAFFPVRLIAVVGDDSDGDIFIEKAKAYGLDTSSMLRAKGVATDITHVMTSAATGRRTFFFRPGANNTLRAEDLLPPDDSARIFYLGSPGGISTSLDESDGWREILRTVRARGFKTCMELCPVTPEKQRAHVRPCLPLLDYMVINDSEGEIVSGLPVTVDGRFDFALAEQACWKLLEMGVQEIAVIHHPDGAVGVRKGGETVRAASVKVPQAEIIGSVGAGDAFYAGVLFGLHENWPLKKCLELGNAAAATSLHSPTTSASIRPWAECLAYAERCGLRALPG